MRRGLSLGCFWRSQLGTRRAFCGLLPPKEEEAQVQNQRRSWRGKTTASPLPCVWELLAGTDLPSLLLLALFTGSLTKRLVFFFWFQFQARAVGFTELQGRVCEKCKVFTPWLLYSFILCNVYFALFLWSWFPKAWAKCLFFTSLHFISSHSCLKCS